MNINLTNANKYKIKINYVMDFFIRHKQIIFPLLLIISYVLFYFVVDFSSQSLMAHDEGLYARRSRLIEQSSNWFSTPFQTPHHKTIGSYWFIALSIKLFGTSELALRLPSILASFLCLIISYLIALRISNKKSALISVFSLSSMPLWIQYSRYASPDLPFVLCILLVIFFFLKSLDNNVVFYKHFYLFNSGLFISSAFFIRSYMVFVPLIGLSPFLLFHLIRFKKNYIAIFLTGILTGGIPIFLNLYFSYRKFGVIGITSLFNFAKKQAIGGFDFNNLLLIPLNYIFLTFPIGLLFIILVIFTKSNITIKNPLLFYCYPLISLVLILLMSTSYPHYFLFLLPSLSFLFAVRLQSFTYRFSFSRTFVKYLLSFLVVIISCSLLFLIFNYSDYLINYSVRNLLLIYIISFLFLLALLLSLKHLFSKINSSNYLIYFFYNIIIPQYISLSLFYNFGVIGNPNYATKSFLEDKYISSIIKSNTIYLYDVDSKIQTLLSFYLPSSIVLESPNNLMLYKYIITSNKNFRNQYESEASFKSIKSFDNHFLLINTSK